MGSRNRQVWALVVTAAGEVLPFKGADLPGVLVVTGTDYRKDGKWSSTTYRFQLSSGTRFISGKNGWETGRFIEGLRKAVSFGRPIDRWVDVAEALGVTVASAMAFLRSWRPKAAAYLDDVEERLATLDDAVEEGVNKTLAISFGAPTNREIRAGYWERPVIVRVNDLEVGRVSPSNGRWNSPIPEGDVSVVAAETSSGMHGGYVSLRLAVPEGATISHRRSSSRTNGQ